MDHREKYGVKVMDHTATFEAYMMFRQTEAEHVANTYPSDTEWVFQSANTEYEHFLMTAYDASLVVNSVH